MRRRVPPAAWAWVAAGVLLALVLHALLRAVSDAQMHSGIQGGFSFLLAPAGFRVSESVLPVSLNDSTLHAIAAGLANTLWICVCAIPAASVLGLLLGVLRLTGHPVLARLGLFWVVPLRNTPVLLQLFAWYGAFLALPPVRASWRPLPGWFISNRGVAFPTVAGSLPVILFALAGGVVAISILATMRYRGRKPGRKQRRQDDDVPARHRAGFEGRVSRPVLATAIAGAAGGIALSSLYYLAGHALPQIDIPVLKGFGIRGGAALSPEFLALFCGLTLFHSAYIADIVVSSVRGVPLSQWQAGQALGLTPSQNARWVVLPHAARSGLLPYTNQCITLLKNSSLAVAIGFPELTAVLGSVIAQSARAIECLLIGTVCYLAIGQLLAAAGQYLNRRFNETKHDDRSFRQLGALLDPAPMTVRTLFGAPLAALTTTVASLVMGVLLLLLIRWGVVDAHFQGSVALCAERSGACWAAVRENLPVLLFGTMTPDARPRATVAAAAVIFGIALPLIHRGRFRVRVALFAAGALVAAVALSGWPLMLPAIPTVDWSGVMLTLMLAATAITSALPIALALALARHAKRAAWREPAARLIDAVRGVPLVTQLLLAASIVPVILGGDWSERKLTLAFIALTLHTACQLAEAFRGGLQAVSASQALAARALGLKERDILFSIVLPQALQHSKASALGVTISAIKDTSLVSILGLIDVLGGAKSILADGTWRPYSTEIYAAVFAFYLLLCLPLTSLVSRRTGT